MSLVCLSVVCVLLMFLISFLLQNVLLPTLPPPEVPRFLAEPDLVGRKFGATISFSKLINGKKTTMRCMCC